MDFAIWDQVQVLYLFSLYQEVMNEIPPCEIEDIDVTIQLANRKTISPMGIVKDVEVLCGKVKYPTYFLILGSIKDKACPIIFGRPFLNTCGAVIDCKRRKCLLDLEMTIMNLILVRLLDNVMIQNYPFLPCWP